MVDVAGKPILGWVWDALSSVGVTEHLVNRALSDAAREMATRWIRHLPVVDAGRLCGMVSMRDVTGVFAALAPGRVDVEHEFDQLVREQRLARIEHGDLD